MKGTITEESIAPLTMGAFAPISIVAPLSSPGLMALLILSMQCMQRTQSCGMSLSSCALLSHSRALVGHLSTISVLISKPFLAYSLTALWSILKLSRQVPMTVKSALAMAATQSLAHPEILILNL